MSFIRVRGRLRVAVDDAGGRRRWVEGVNTFTDYGLFLLMYWLFGTASIPTKGNTSPSGTYGIGDGTRYNDGVNVYPSPFDGNANSLSGPIAGATFSDSFAAAPAISLNNTATSGIVSNYAQIGTPGGSNGFTYLLGPLAWLGAILVATNDQSSPSETAMVFGQGVTALWSNMDPGVSVDGSSTWTLTGSTSQATPPTAQWVFINANTATQPVQIYSFAWVLPFTVGSVASKTAPTQQTSLSTVYTNGTGTSLTNWPIIAKVTLQSPINVAAGGKLSVVNYSFTLAN